MQVVADIVHCSCGGNILINVGPTADGMIIPVYEERLRQLGSWLQVNGEAIYASKPWTYQNDTLTPAVWLVIIAMNVVCKYCICIQTIISDGLGFKLYAVLCFLSMQIINFLTFSHLTLLVVALPSHA